MEKTENEMYIFNYRLFYLVPFNPLLSYCTLIEADRLFTDARSAKMSNSVLIRFRSSQSKYLSPKSRRVILQKKIIKSDCNDSRKG